jgi:hypothetical protein
MLVFVCPLGLGAGALRARPAGWHRCLVPGGACLRSRDGAVVSGMEMQGNAGDSGDVALAGLASLALRSGIGSAVRAAP